MIAGGSPHACGKRQMGVPGQRQDTRSVPSPGLVPRLGPLCDCPRELAIHIKTP